MDKINRIMKITNRYLERFGRALIGIYYLPPLAENWKFTVFINSLQVTLRRMDLIPGYCWFMDTNEGHYLMLWLNGYSQLASTHFRNVTIAVITFSSGNGRGSGRW